MHNDPREGGARAPLGSAIGLTARGGAYLGQRDPTTGPEVGTHPGHRHPRLGPRGPPTPGCAVLRARGGGHFGKKIGKTEQNSQNAIKKQQKCLQVAVGKQVRGGSWFPLVP